MSSLNWKAHGNRKYPQSCQSYILSDINSSKNGFPYDKVSYEFKIGQNWLYVLKVGWFSCPVKKVTPKYMATVKNLTLEMLLTFFYGLLYMLGVCHFIFEKISMLKFSPSPSPLSRLYIVITQLLSCSLSSTSTYSSSSASLSSPASSSFPPHLILALLLQCQCKCILTFSFSLFSPDICTPPPVPVQVPVPLHPHLFFLTLIT